MTEPFRFIAPTLPPLEEVLALYAPAYRDGMITNSRLVARFEAAVAERLGVRHCVAVSSCTSGLMLVFKALGIEGEVILPSFTFFATAHSALWNRLRPVFADCDPETWTICPQDAERKITSRTAAILGVHLYGNPCEVETLSQLASRNGLKLIFDAAHAFGSQWQGRPVGQFGDAEVFSLSPTKVLVAGEGGLVTTNDAALAKRVRAGRNYGDAGNYDPELLGLNARMTEFNAALGLAGLGMVDAKVERHNLIAAEYARMLGSTRGVGFQMVRAGNVSSYKDYSIHIDAGACGSSRDELRGALLARNIETRAYFSPAVHQQGLYRTFSAAALGSLPQTEMLADGILSLPIYHDLPLETVARIALAVREAMPEPHHV
ncbi:MAG TPA: DegT/DnrJ/EryC1/StrS family aminotransferase [Bryobacteraceae bacterium]|nr:DegT/DnrJ/EryC1/StrS family aminotransferase [Bryobacteraceae bacterium]